MLADGQPFGGYNGNRVSDTDEELAIDHTEDERDIDLVLECLAQPRGTGSRPPKVALVKTNGLDYEHQESGTSELSSYRLEASPQPTVSRAHAHKSRPAYL